VTLGLVLSLPDGESSEPVYREFFVDRLATSREAIAIAGEVVWRVPSLVLPPRRSQPSPDRLAEYEAVQLFVARARLAQPSFELNQENAGAVSDICWRLDGLPLALELAAARTTVLAPRQILERLSNRFGVLAMPRRDAPARHQTLRALVDWSYDLLSETERTAFNRLAVFAGSWSLEAAESVAAGDGIEQNDVLDLLSHLVDKSLVLAEPHVSGTIRYRLLETLRQYAQERLADSGERRATRQRHARYCLGVAEQASRALTRPEHGPWLARLEDEHDNLRAALTWGLESEDSDLSLRLGAALWRFWRYRGHLAEAETWLARVLALPGGSVRGRAHAFFGAGFIATRRGMFSRARTYFEEARVFATQVDDWHVVAGVLTQLGNLARMEGDMAAARTYHTQGLAIRRQRQADNDNLWEHRWGIAMSVVALAQVAVEEEGPGVAARQLSEEGVKLAREIGDPMILGLGLMNLGRVDLAEGKFANAHANFSELVVSSHRSQSVEGLLNGLGCFARLAQARGRADRAVLLLGALSAQREAFGFERGRPFKPDVAQARQGLGEAAFEAAWSDGRALSIDDAIKEALAEAAL
jgi:predicted ATPase